MTGDEIDPNDMMYMDKSDEEVATMVRMLYRNQLDHEAVCVGARDRIMYLSQELGRARDEIRQKDAESTEIINDTFKKLVDVTAEMLCYREALKRLASPEAFVISRATNQEDRARMKFAEDTITSASDKQTPYHDIDEPLCEDDACICHDDDAAANSQNQSGIRCADCKRPYRKIVKAIPFCTCSPKSAERDSVVGEQCPKHHVRQPCHFCDPRGPGD